MHFNIDASRADMITAAEWGAAFLLTFFVLGFIREQLNIWMSRRAHAAHRAFDDQRAREERDQLARERATCPLPGPALAGEVVRRMIYALALDAAGRPTEATRQREIAGQLGALAQLAMSAGDEWDREAWSAELSASEALIGVPLTPVEGFTDPAATPPPALARTPYAQEGTPQWREALEALAAAVRANIQPDDFGPGMMGRGVLMSAHAYGYAAAPELPRETVEGFLRDWCLRLHGEAPERTWPVDLPDPRPEWSPEGLTASDPGWADAILALRSNLEQVIEVTDFRGLMGREKSEIVTDLIDRHGRGPLSRKTITEYVTDYTLALTGQNVWVTGAWPPGTMPDVDPSRVTPLPDEQPDGIRDVTDSVRFTS